MAEKTFTESLAILKATADEIGRPNTTLEDALRLYQEGMKESEYCSRILDEAEQKIEEYSPAND